MEIADIRNKDDFERLYREKELYLYGQRINYLLNALGVLGQTHADELTQGEELSCLEQQCLEFWDREPSQWTKADCSRLSQELISIHRQLSALSDRMNTCYPYAFIRSKDKEYVENSLNMVREILSNVSHYLSENSDKDKSLSSLYEILTQNELMKLANKIFESQTPPDPEISKAFSNGLGEYAEKGFSDSE